MEVVNTILSKTESIAIAILIGCCFALLVALTFIWKVYQAALERLETDRTKTITAFVEQTHTMQQILDLLRMMGGQAPVPRPPVYHQPPSGGHTHHASPNQTMVRQSDRLPEP